MSDTVSSLHLKLTCLQTDLVGAPLALRTPEQIVDDVVTMESELLGAAIMS
jgi:hypothetical protein